MKTAFPLSGRGSEINYEHGYIAKWKKTKLTIPDSVVNDILNNFFIDKTKWYPLGASETNPMPRGLGEFITTRYTKLNPRHASAIAAIMYQENLIETKGQKPILLRKK